MKKIINIILVDDHEIIRDGLSAGFKFDKDINVIGEAGNESELLKILNVKKPDIIIMDINMPDKSGIEITKELSKKYKIIMFSAIVDAQTVVTSLKVGAMGFLPKATVKTEIKKAIISVYYGENYITDAIANNVLVKHINGDVEIKVAPTGIELLTKRELEILAHIAEGYMYKEIAEKLFISSRTVETHKTNIMNKLELNNIAELIKFAIKNRIIEI